MGNRRTEKERAMMKLGGSLRNELTSIIEVATGMRNVIDKGAPGYLDQDTFDLVKRFNEVLKLKTTEIERLLLEAQ